MELESLFIGVEVIHFFHLKNEEINLETATKPFLRNSFWDAAPELRSRGTFG